MCVKHKMVSHRPKNATQRCKELIGTIAVMNFTEMEAKVSKTFKRFMTSGFLTRG